MSKEATYYDRRLMLEASFDGPIPSRRLADPRPARKPADASLVMRQIAERRRLLTAGQARTDEALARLSRHLAWLVAHDRRNTRRS